MAVEDLHWIDKSSEDTLKALLDSISGERIFLIFTYRPEFVHTWGGKSYHNQVNLNRLSNSECLAMVTYLLGTENIDGDLEELILDKTEGVPFFIEEFIKSLKDLNVIERNNSIYQLSKNVEAVSIPSTIQDVIMARVDTLPEGAKELLQSGSAIEREFSYEVIRQVSDLSEQELLSRLSVLKDSELLFERGIYPKTNFIFKHALTQEVIYSSILAQKKKELHNKIGQTIEQLYKDNLYEHYGIIAEHFINGNNFENGAKYCRLAERKAEKAGSLNNAIEYGEKQITCLESLPHTEDLEKRLIDARTKLGLYYVQMAESVKAKEAVDPIVDLATKHNYNRRVSQINAILGFYQFTIKEDALRVSDYLQKALKIGEELNDILSLAMANMLIGYAQTYNCEYANAFQSFEKVLKMNVAANSHWGISTMKSVIAMWVYNTQGKIDLGYENSNEALRIADESGDIYSKAFAYTNHGWSCYYKGYLEKAKEYLLKGADFSIRINQLLCILTSQYGLGMTFFDMEEYKISQKHYKRMATLYQDSCEWPTWVNCAEIALALAKVMNNEKDVNLDKIFKCYGNIKIKLTEGWVLRCVGEILLNIDDRHISEAEKWIKKAIKSHKRNGMMWHLAKDHSLYAELFKRKGDLPKAKENLSKTIEIFKECGADGWVEKYEKELAKLS
jgi:tetratricopeptide (TPR) repeat protein